jgi:phage portal protein BeeE
MHLLDQLHWQSLPRLAPGRVGELKTRQMIHRRAGNIPTGNLLGKEPQRVAGRESGVSKKISAHSGKLIDASRKKMMIHIMPNASQSLIERCHPWPPVG